MLGRIWESRKEAVGRLLDFQKLRSLWPLGLIYGIGDFCQTIACSSASGRKKACHLESKLFWGDSSGA
eukprot:3194851-Amphidinium_carterae.1